MSRVALSAAVAVLCVAAAQADDDPKAVVERGVKAMGGAEALKKFAGWEYKAEGEATVGAQKVKYTISTAYAAPDKLRVSMESATGTSKSKVVMIANGDKVKATRDDKAEEVKDPLKGKFLQTAQTHEVCLLLPLVEKDGKYTLKAEKDEKVGGADAAVVLVQRKNMDDLKLYFDKKTDRLVKFVQKMPDAEGKDVPTEVTQGDFKAFDGVLMPQTLSSKQNGKETMTMRVTEMKMTEKPDATKFEIK